MAKKFLLAVLFFVFFSLKPGVAQPDTSSTGRPVGVIWSLPDSREAAKEQLEYFSGLGIQFLQVDDELPRAVWNLISKLNFKVYALLPVRFPVTPAFGKTDSALQTKLNHRLRHYASHQPVKAIGLFAYGPVYEPGFQKEVSRFLTRIKDEINLPVYYVASDQRVSPVDSLFNFKTLRFTPSTGNIPTNKSTGAYFVFAKTASPITFSFVKRVLKSIQNERQTPVFFDAELLLKLTDKFPEFEKTLAFYTTAPDYPIPLSHIDLKKSGYDSILVLLLLLTWLILAATYYVSPVYRSSFYRYFTGHQFYLIDVFERHIRSLLPGASILIQQIILTGIAFYCVVNSAISPLGTEALMYHYSVLSIFGDSTFAFLIWGFAVAILFEALCTCWLWVVNPTIKYLSQVLNLYPWLLQLNIIIVSVMVVVFVSGGSRLLIYLTGLLFLIITLAPFIVASVDGANSLPSKQRVWTINFTLVLYIVLLAGLFIWIYLSPHLLKVVELALTI